MALQYHTFMDIDNSELGTQLPEFRLGGGGGHSGIEWVPTAKETCGALNSVEGKKWASQLQTKNPTRVDTVCLFSLCFCKICIIIT